MKVHIPFILHTLHAFKQSNLLLQNQDSLIAILGNEYHKLTNNITSKFLRPQCI